MAYVAKKLYLGKHELDNGKTWTGSGFAVVNEQGQIKTCSTWVEVFEQKAAAEKAAEYFNETDGGG